ncbi:MAG: YecA family protein [Blastocatellia bacterium]
MSTGRNDPCPCGSGKKYKKCCLAKDEEAKGKETAASPVSAATPALPARKERPKPPPDPRVEAWNARYEKFEASDYEGRIALFTRTLAEPELMDGEMAFEMLSELFEPAVEHNERDRFDALIESLRERLPKVYEKEAHYLLENLIMNALVMQRAERVDSLARELARLAGNQIDTWNQVESRLAYHGYLATLVETMREAWPKVRESSKIVPWGVDKFSNRASQYEMLHYIAETHEPRGDDPILLERMRALFGDEFDSERMAEMTALMAGQDQRRWTMEDFKLEPPRRRSRDAWDDDEEDEDDEKTEEKKGDPGRSNLFNLTLQFIGYAHRVEGVSYTKANLASGEIFRFITRRHAGELEYHESMLDSALRSAGKKRDPIKKYNRYEHLLCPDRERWDTFLAGMLQMLNHQPHNVAAAMELVPAWMRFLQTQGLIDAELRRRTLDALKKVAADLLKGMSGMHADPTLAAAIKHWPEDADREPR